MVLISYGKTLNMYWWVDDWGLLFKMIHPESAPGNLGTGIWGSGAYRFLATPFIFLYPFFGTNAQPYFILGLAQYFLASVVVYLFTKELLLSKKVAIGAAVIFASGYFGSFALYRLSNSYQLSDSTISIYLSAYFLIRYLRGTGKNNYLFSLFIFVSALIFLFLRVHGIILVIFAVYGFWVVKNWKSEQKNIMQRFFELLPFLFIYFYLYLINYAGGTESSGLSGGVIFGEFIKFFFSGTNFLQINNLIYSFSGALIPNTWTLSFYGLFGKTFSADKLVIVTGYVVLVLTVILPVAFEKFSRYLVYLPLSALFVFSNIVTYFIANPAGGLESFNRYIMPSLVGTSIYFSCLFISIPLIFKLSGKYTSVIFFVLIFSISYSLIHASYYYQNEILQFVSYPTRNAYKVIKDNVSKVDANTIFLIDSEDDPRVKNNLLSGMGQLGISIFYNYNDYTNVADGFDDLFSQLSNGKVDLKDTYTFFASKELGFVSTTDNFRKELFTKLPAKLLNGWNYVGNYAFIDKVDYPSLLPTSLTIKMVFRSKETSNLLVPTKVWWMTERRDTYQTFYSTDLNIYNDGLPHLYTIYIPAGGINIKNIRIGGFTEGKVEILYSSIVNLTLPEFAGKRI